MIPLIGAQTSGFSNRSGGPRRNAAAFKQELDGQAMPKLEKVGRTSKYGEAGCSF